MLWFSNPWFAMTYYGVAVLYFTTLIFKLRPVLLSVSSAFCLIYLCYLLYKIMKFDYSLS